MPPLVALCLEIAEAIPALRDLFAQIGDEIRKAQLASTHNAIDDAIAQARRAPWVCPAACPHAAERLRNAGPAGAPVPPAS